VGTKQGKALHPTARALGKEISMKNRVEVFWFSEQPYGYVTDAELAQYDSGRLVENTSTGEEE
jgi:hypothetical protein